MCTNETVKCPHCAKPQTAQLKSNDTSAIMARRPCADCRQTYLEELADTLFAVLTSRLEYKGRSRCSVVEQEQDDLATGTMVRRILRVESLRHDVGCIAEATFDYDMSQLRVCPKVRPGTGQVEISACHFPLDDIRLSTIIRNFAKVLSLDADDKDKDVGEEVRFRELIESIRLSFQLPCQHTPPCPDF